MKNNLKMYKRINKKYKSMIKILHKMPNKSKFQKNKWKNKKLNVKVFNKEIIFFKNN